MDTKLNEVSITELNKEGFYISIKKPAYSKLNNVLQWFGYSPKSMPVEFTSYNNPSKYVIGSYDDWARKFNKPLLEFLQSFPFGVTYVSIAESTEPYEVGKWFNLRVSFDKQESLTYKVLKDYTEFDLRELVDKICLRFEVRKLPYYYEEEVASPIQKLKHSFTEEQMVAGKLQEVNKNAPKIKASDYSMEDK